MENLNDKKVDKLTFDFSVNYRNSNNNSYNYRKIAESLKIELFRKAVIFAGILNEGEINEILKYPQEFINSKSKYDRFSPQKKAFRLYGQSELKKCSLLNQKGIETKQRENNYKFILSFC